MNIINEYDRLEKEIIEMIGQSNYPANHPFLYYPNTPESMPIKMLIIIYFFTSNKKMISGLIDKCNGKDFGVFSFKKYREGISELTWLYYLIIGNMINKNIVIKQ